MARLTGVDLAVFDIGGASVLADLREAEVMAETAFADVTSVVSTGEARIGVKQNVRITNGLMSSKPGGVKVTHLDVSLVELAGLDYRAVIEQGVFEGQVRFEDGSGLSDEWEWPVAVRKDYRARVEMMVDSAGSVALVGKAFGALAGKDVGVSVVINGVVVTVPMVMARFRHMISSGRRQKWQIDLQGSAGVGAAYPTAPVGSASLLAHAFTAPGAPLLVRVVPGVGQPALEGGFLVSQFGFRFARNAVVDSTYDFVSQGVVALS